ncbi:hypothetical protein FQV23_0006795, partial [Spheniscus humboldti]
ELEAAIINITQTTESMSNTTTNEILALQEEVSGISKVVLQNRLALDVVLASQGDVCI